MAPQRDPDESAERARDVTRWPSGGRDPAPARGACVLIVADDPIMIEVLSRYLDRAGIKPAIAEDGPSGLDLLRRVAPDLIVLDTTLPGLDGRHFCHEARANAGIPVIALTSPTTAGDGPGVADADDHLTMPFSPRGLVLRIQAVLDRSGALGCPSGAVLVAGGLVVNESSRVASKEGRALELSDRELKLLVFLLRNPGLVFRRDELVRDAWGYGSEDVCAAAVHIRRLREKIEDDPARPTMLVTVWGAGYRFDPPGPLGTTRS